MWYLSLAVGVITGVLSGMGVGGGTLLVLYLTAVLGTEAYAAAGINLVYFLGCAPASLLFHIREQRIDRRIAVAAAVSGVITAAVAAWLVPMSSPDWLRRGFGAVLLLVGLRECYSLVHSAKKSG